MIIPGTRIIVDKFTKQPSTEQYVYFLSHLHSDHTQGLSNSWKAGIIYCTRVTRILLLNKFPNLEPLIIAIDYQSPTLITTPDGSFRVIAFDANHIIGSAMFIFEGKFGRILYTGDFRFTEDMFQYEYLYPSSMKNPLGTSISIPIDLLILDNTFCDPIYAFPSQSTAFIEIVKIIQDHPKSTVYLFMYNIGKEELLIKLAHTFSTTVQL